MIGKNRISLAFAAAVLTFAMPVVAQVQPSGPAVQTPQDTVKLNMEERHTIKELIKDMKVPPPSGDQAASVPTTVGQTVPEGATLQPMPVEVSAKVPQIKSHSFVMKGDQVVIVDSKDRKVAAVVD